MRKTQTRTQTPQQAGARRQRQGGKAEQILEQYSKSGLTQRVFAREVGVGLSTLQLWLRQARLSAESGTRRASTPKRAKALSLLEVELDGGSVPTWQQAGARYEMELTNGARLRLAACFRDDEVRRLLVLLQEVR
jgi:transposase-like protein